MIEEVTTTVTKQCSGKRPQHISLTIFSFNVAFDLLLVNTMLDMNKVHIV